ncbi:MAG: hypothetical protein H8D43_03330 [Chloroflexi bacterium]|nr:hypothetical protein [Chloroflexota bacterium]
MATTQHRREGHANFEDVPDAVSEHHSGRPFLTAYQPAIEFARRHADDAAELGFPIGGVGTGQRNSLAQYLAGQLFRNIQDGRLPDIEGGILSNQHLNGISFDVDGEVIHSSLTGTDFTLSMFRLRDSGLMKRVASVVFIRTWPPKLWSRGGRPPWPPLPRTCEGFPFIRLLSNRAAVIGTESGDCSPQRFGQCTLRSRYLSIIRTS